MVTSDDDDDDDDVESVIYYYPKNPSCTLYVTLNVKKIQKLVECLTGGKREKRRKIRHTSSRARPSVALKQTSSYYSLNLACACTERQIDFNFEHQPKYFENIRVLI